MASGHALAALPIVALLLALAAVPSAATPPGRLLTPRPVGTVDTVAGPGFCTGGTSKPNPASTAVGDVAADAKGALWFESGVVGDVTRVINTTAVAVVRAAVGPPEDQSRRPQSTLGRKPPSRLAADGRGGLIVAAPTAVLRFDSGSVTIAGTTAPDREGGDTGPLIGDDGPLAAARFTRIAALAADHAGNVFVADEIDERASAIAIRFLNRGEVPVTFFPGTPHELTVAPGTINTLAGGGAGMPVATMKAAAPILAVAGDRLYVGSTAPRPGTRMGVRVLNLAGSEREVHGVGVPPATAAEVITVKRRAPSAQASQARPVPELSGIAADEDGNLFLAEPANHRVQRIDSAGAVTTFAGTGVAGFNGNGQPAAEARLSRPYDVEVGAQGRVYISDAGNDQVRFVDRGGMLQAALGNGATTAWDCAPAGPGAADAASPALGSPSNLATDRRANVYVVSTELGQVLRLGPSGTLQPVAGRARGSCDRPDRCPTDDTAPPTSADLAGLVAVAQGPRAGLHIVEPARARFLNLSRRPVSAHGVDVPPGAMRTVAGVAPSGTTVATTSTSFGFTQPPPPTPDGDQAAGPSTGAVFTAAAVDPGGNLLLGDVPAGPLFIGRASVRQVDAAGIITTLVPRLDRRPDGSIDPTRCCAYVSGLRTDDDGNVYIADTVAGRVWFLNRGARALVVHGVAVAAGAIEAVAGAGVGAGTQDEAIPALHAQLTRPAGLALDAAGNLYVVDSREHSVHRVDSRGVITTVVGTGQPGFNGDGLRGQSTSLNEPVGVVVDACGNLLVAEKVNHRVRRFNVTTCPAARVAARSDGPARSLAAATGAVAAAALAAVAAASAAAVWRRDRKRAQGPG